MTDPHTEGRWSDHAVEQTIGRLLQIGVLLAAAVTLLGGGLLLAQHGGSTASFATFNGEPRDLRSLSGIASGAFTLRSEAVVQLGLVLLIATPLARVALTLVAFALQRDRVYVAITALVLALLLYGLLSGNV